MLLVLLALVAILGTGCGGGEPEEPAAVHPTAQDREPATRNDPALPAGPWFTDEAVATGLAFEHHNGMTGELYFAEMMGAGGALVDVDQDGDLDVYLVQGGPLPPAPGGPTDRLFRNQLVETGRLAFTDASAAAGLTAAAYGMGVAVGDVDNDGLPDLYRTAFGADRLLHNLGGGRFRPRGVDAGPGDPGWDDGWSVSAAFADLDGDGWLDLYVGRYVDYRLDRHKPCYAPSSAIDYCGPLSYTPEPDLLYRNRGDGTFAAAAGELTSAYGAALGVAVLDTDGDGRPELYVANDAGANQLWGPGAGGRLVDRALVAGCAYNGRGTAEGSMGVAAGDADGDGDDDLLVTHIPDETNTYYRADGGGHFLDRTASSGLAAASRRWTGFGTGFLDVDNDGWLDLLVVNGAVRILPHQAGGGDPHPLKEPDQVFRNRGDGTFEDASGRAGEVFAAADVSRGAAFGDIDNDGDLDVLVTVNGGRARLLVNRVGQERPWLGLRLVDDHDRDAYGAVATAVLDDGRRLVRRVRTDSSYASASDPRLLFGLGAGRVEEVQVRWPDGRRERFSWHHRPTRAYVTLRPGDGSGNGLGSDDAGAGESPP